MTGTLSYFWYSATFEPEVNDPRLLRTAVLKIIFVPVPNYTTKKYVPRKGLWCREEVNKDFTVREKSDPDDFCLGFD